MTKKSKFTTKPHYKTGYDAAENNQSRKSPHREGTALETIWLAGWDAYMDGGTAPEEPRKKRTKAEMEEALRNPIKATLPESMVRRAVAASTYVSKPRADGLIENLFVARDNLVTETDPELRELLTMEHADLEWLVCVEEGAKPSDRWEEYKKDKGLSFDRNAA